MTHSIPLSRRAFVGFSAASLAAAGISTTAPNKALAADNALAADAGTSEILRATRPAAPYRIWFQPRQFHRDMGLYRHMTIDASGWIDPRLSELAGKTTLDWVYGLNHPWADGPGYWSEACSPQSRTRTIGDSQFISAGIAVDEWVPPKLPKNPQWLAEGLRAGRAAHPDVFIAVWATDPTAELLEITADGTVDLVIVQGYTHSVAPGLTTSWEGALRRCDALVEAGLEAKTILSFGHITDQPDSRGGLFDVAWLREKAGELRRRYPQMPGVAFFQSTDPDSPRLREIIRECDAISHDLWPSPPA